MDTNSMMGFLDVIVVLAGAYLLYGWYLLVFQNEIKEGLVISKNTNPKKCKDLEGFKKTMGPKLLVFGLIAVAQGGIGLFNSYVHPLPSFVYWIFYALFFVALIWYVITARKAEKEFF